MGTGNGWDMSSYLTGSTGLSLQAGGTQLDLHASCHPFVRSQSLQSPPAPSQTGTLPPHPHAAISPFTESHNP